MNRNKTLILFITIGCVLTNLMLSGFLPGSTSHPGLTSQSTPKPPGIVPDDNEVNRLARQMYCPVCENIPLDVCPTQACNEWRELIRLKLSQGWSDEQIKDYFVMQYGDRVLAEPPRRGINWLVYILPVLFFLVGVYILFRVLSSMRKSPSEGLGDNFPTATSPKTSQSQASSGSVTMEEIYLRRLEEEIKKKEQ